MSLTVLQLDCTSRVAMVTVAVFFSSNHDAEVQKLKCAVFLTIPDGSATRPLDLTDGSATRPDGWQCH